MGNFYVKGDDGIWDPALVWAKPSSAGWTRAKQAYRKTGPTTWTLVQTFDLTPPAPPVITSIVQEGNLLKITVTAPTTPDVKSVRVKVLKGDMFSSVSVGTDVGYLSLPDGNDVAWSDWTMSPGQTRTKYFPPPELGGLTNGASYTVFAWAQDAGRNFSSPVMQTQKFIGTTTGPLPSARTTYLTTNDSRTFNRAQNTWWTDKGVRTGDVSERIGLWFYGDKLKALLANSIELSELTLQIQRVNAYDYAGAANFKLFAHTMAGWSNINVDTYRGGYSVVIAVDSVWHTLNRGQTGNFVIPGAWYDQIRNGTIKGFGISSQAGVNTDRYCGSYYGYGTSSGRLYAEWVQ